jgi:hypothetical protein
VQQAWEGFTMDLATVFDWLAQDSMLAAELTTDSMQHLAQLALMWSTSVFLNLRKFFGQHRRAGK